MMRFLGYFYAFELHKNAIFLKTDYRFFLLLHRNQNGPRKPEISAKYVNRINETNFSRKLLSVFDYYLYNNDCRHFAIVFVFSNS